MSTTHVSTLGDPGDRDADPGSLPWAKWLVGQIHLRRHELSSCQKLLDDLLAKIDNYEAWRVLGFASREGLLASLPDHRVYKPRVANLRHEPLGDAVYVGRANPRRGLAESAFANPYRVDVDGSRAEVIQKYRSWLLGRHELVLRLHELRGRRLACWCSPEPCHSDVLVELVDADELLDGLASAGVTVEAVDGRLRLSPPSAVDAVLLARVKACKPAMLELLARRRPPVPDAAEDCRRLVEAVAESLKLPPDVLEAVPVRHASVERAGGCDPLKHEPQAAGVDARGWTRYVCRKCGRFYSYSPGQSPALKPAS